MDRIACAWIPRFELCAQLRGQPPSDDGPLGLVELVDGGGARIRVASEEAERYGVRAGQPLGQARAVCPEMAILALSPERLASAQKEVMRALGTLSPRLDSDDRGSFFLSLAGLERLVPDERRFAAQIAEVVRDLGFPVRVTVASTAFVAWVSAIQAKESEALQLIPSGAETASLRRVPLSALGLSEAGEKLLAMLGLCTAGDVARLPAGALSQRLGPEGKRLERLCRQERAIAAPSIRHLPLDAPHVELDLDGAVEALEALLFLLKSLLDRLLAALGQEQKGLVELTVEAELDDHSVLCHAVVPAEPTMQSQPLMDLIRLWLDTRPFAAPVRWLRLIASKTGVAPPRQWDLFLLQQKEVAAWERASARLLSAFGHEALVRPRLEDVFLPEARLHWEPVKIGAAPPRNANPPAPKAAASLVLRRVNPPEPVQWDRRGIRRQGQPVQRVTHREGPRRLAGGFWDAPFDRSYHWVTLADGALWWLFRDEPRGQFFLQGVAD